MKAKLNFEDAAVRGELLRTLVHNTPVAYIILDKHYKVQFINYYSSTAQPRHITLRYERLAE